MCPNLLYWPRPSSARGLAASLAFAGSLCLSGCAGSPDAGSLAHDAKGVAGTTEVDGHAAVTGAAHREEPFYSLAAGAGSSARDTSLEAAWEAFASGDEAPVEGTPAARRVAAGGGLSEAPEQALVGELQERWSREWTELAGGLGTTPGAVQLGHRQATAAKIVALSFVREDHGAGDEAVREAAALLGQDDSPRDLRFLAAAAQQHAGNDAEVERIVGGLGYCPLVAAMEEPAAATDEPPPFEVVGLSFAQVIEGPGKFVPLAPEEIVPGKPLLLYGEFRNFASVRAPSRDATKSLHRRSFRASLRLLTRDDKEIDRLEFLPEKRGRQTGESLSDVTNFWAKYRLPPDLEPGSYRLVIDAEDLLGQAEAAAELPLEIRQP